MHHLTLWAAGFTLVCFAAYHLLKGTKQNKNGIIPLPQPYQVPLIGRIHDLPIAKMWLKFQEWAEIHGPIYYTSMLGNLYHQFHTEQSADSLQARNS